MRDQAASLRELRANYDKMIAKSQGETHRDFLAKIKRVSPLSAYVLIYLDSINYSYPDIDKWLLALTNNPTKLYLWDQANIINTKVLSSKPENILFPVLPKQMAMIDLPGKSDSERFEFLKKISNTLDKHNEVWVTIKASEISYYKYLIKSSNRLYIMLPEDNNATIKGYEAVKNIYNLDISSKINLLEFSSKFFINQSFISNKIKNVAKQFLGIDLFIKGVVLSNCKFIPSDYEGLQNALNSHSEPSDDDFMYVFSENIVNLPLGTH